MLSPKAMEMPIIHDVTDSHVVVHGPSASGSSVDTHGQCYHQKSCGCPWLVPPPTSVLISMDQTAAGDHTGVHDLCCHKRP